MTIDELAEDYALIIEDILGGFKDPFGDFDQVKNVLENLIKEVINVCD